MTPPACVVEVCRGSGDGDNDLHRRRSTVEFMKVAIGGILAGFVVSGCMVARCDSSAAGAVMNPRRDRSAVLAAIRFLSDCGTYWLSGILAAVAAGMTITRSGVMAVRRWQCACAQTAPGRCWNFL